MGMRILPHAAAMSQFVSGYGGACTWTARRVCLHVLDPNRWSLYPPALADDIRQAISDKLAAASGACRIVDIAASLTQWDHLAYHLSPYQEPWAQDGPAGWHTLLTTTAGYQPILLQVANGAAFGYAPGLQYHAIAILGHDSDAQTYAVADSDNKACWGGQLVTYSLAELIAAKPCGAIVPGPLPVPMPAPAPAVDVAAIRAAIVAARDGLNAALAKLG